MQLHVGLLYAPRGGHVRAFPGVSRKHNRGQIRVKAMERHKLECKILGTTSNIVCEKQGSRKFRKFFPKLSEFVEAHRRQGTKKKRTKKSSRHGFLRKCQPPACQRFPGGNERQERKGAVPGQEDGKDRGEGREPSAQEKEVKNSAILHNMWRQKAMVLGEARVHCSIVCLAKRSEGLGVQSLAWQISPIYRLLVEGPFVLDGTKRFHDKPQGRIVLRVAKRVGPPELRQMTVVSKWISNL